MDRLIELFCDVDDFCQSFLPGWQKQMLTAGAMQRQRERSLSVSEIMTILVHFHQAHYRHFKAYYTEEYFEGAYHGVGHFLDDVYMTKRVHSALGYRTPAEFEVGQGAPLAGMPRSWSQRGSRASRQAKTPSKTG